MRYYKIYVDNTNGLFTYEDKNDEFSIGERVVVFFRNKKKTGIIIEEDNRENIDFKVLPILGRVENSIILSKEYIKMLVWVAKYYLATYEQVFTAAIPTDLHIKYNSYYCLLSVNNLLIDEEIDKKIRDFFSEKLSISRATLVKKFGSNIVNELIENKLLQKREKSLMFDVDNEISKKNCYNEIVKYFHDKLKFKNKYLEEKIGVENIKNLLNKGYIIKKKEYNSVKIDDSYGISEEVTSKDVLLNEEQNSAKNKILNGEDRFYLLKGITGSGKTEVYISVIKEAFFKDEGTIFLVPEISLTPQMVDRFKNEFKENIAILHSKLTNKDRAQEWLDIYYGKKKIVLGVRSAIFAPVRNLKYIFLDEEHENTYKQDSNPRYNAKQVAIRRAQLENAKVILGSATPSIESYYYAKEKIFNLIELKNRYNNYKEAPIEIIDMKEEEDLFFSKKLIDEMRKALLRKEQVILLLNRKGYSTYVQCKDCGSVEECPHCSIKYSYYQSQNLLKCNYCGNVKRYTGMCSSCGSKNLIHSGKGVERIEEEIKKYFDVSVIRVDSESSKEKDFYENLYYDFLEGKYDIMIGTQIISKGLHFPNVTLVGIVNADTILNFPDFRASEKTYQLIIQAAGRAGRGEKPGKVLVQTYQSENTIFEKISKNDYDGFYDYEIEARELLEYPPYGKLINIGISSKDERYLENYVKDFYNYIKCDTIEMYGPLKSLVYKVKDRYRYNILIKGTKKNIDSYRKKLALKLKNLKTDIKIRIVIDIDPINLI